MVLRINSSLPAADNQRQSYAEPFMTMLALASVAYMFIRVTKSLIGRASMSDPGKLHRAGGEDFQNQRYDEAISKFTLALECKLDLDMRMCILMDRAAIYIIQLQYDKSIDDLTRALDCNPDGNQKASILADLALAYLESQNPQKAMENYDLAVQCLVEDELLARIYFSRGIVYAQMDEHERALGDFNRALDICSDAHEQASIRYQRGCSYVALKRFKEAIADFTEAVIACSNDQEAVLILEDRAKAQIMIGRQEDAMEDYQLILKYDLDEQQRLHFQESFFFCQGAVYTKNHEYEKAVESYTKVLEYDSHHPEAKAHILYLRCHAYGRMKQFDLCETDISEAIKCGSDKVQLFGARGVARMRLKKYLEAIQDLTTAMDINPTDEEWKAELLYIRGVAHRENNNPVGACQDWEAALKCTFTKEGLREKIEAALNQKTDQPVDTIDTIWDQVALKLPDSLQK